MIGIGRMSMYTSVTMESPMEAIRKKKTRRGKKKKSSWREMIPPSADPRKIEREGPTPADRSDQPCTCRCGSYNVRSPVKSPQGRLPTPSKKNKPYLRPSAPRAPPNSTQFIMDCHLDQDFSMYGSEVCGFCHSSPPLSEGGSPSPQHVIWDISTVQVTRQWDPDEVSPTWLVSQLRSLADGRKHMS